MANSSDLSFQQAIYTALSSALPTVTISANVPGDSALPFIKIGQTELNDFPLGKELFPTIDTWSDAEGPHQIKTMQQSIREALEHVPLTAGGWTFTCIREDFCSVFQEVQNQVWHGVQRFRVIANA